MWSEELRNRTRAVLKTLPIAYIMQDVTIPIKKFSMRHFISGTIHINDASTHNFLIIGRDENETIWQYNTLDELILDGWAIDG
jgi:hypothetical protein